MISPRGHGHGPGDGAAATVNSALACVHCAKSKARCDRKVPCTRCVCKKLTCEARLSQRGAKRLPLSQHSRASNPETTAPQATDDGGGGGGNEETRNGIWMDWSHRFDASRPLSRSGGLSEAAQKESEDFLAQLVAAAVSGADDGYPPSGAARPDASMPSFMDSLNNLVHFTAPTPSSSPTPRTALGPGEDMAFPALSPGALMSFSNNAEAMEGYEPVPPSLLGTERAHADSGPDPDQIEALEGWPLFQCNPVTPPSACPLTSGGHVKNLYALLKDDCRATTQGRPPGSRTALEPLLASTREKITAVLQGLFYEAQQLYGLRSQDHGLHDWVGASVLTLPPPAEMEFLLRAYVDCCEPHYPVMPLASMEVNEHIEGSDTMLPSMGLLLMLAVGAMAADVGEPYPEISHGLVDICRTSLRRLVEQNMKLASDPGFTRCALLSVIATVWSGDKWLMDIGMYLKAMYLEMHLTGGLHESREEQLAQLNASKDAAHRSELWKCQEVSNRATYFWLILDYEICLFHDIPSTSCLSVVNLDKPIPSPDATLTSPSAKHWVQNVLSRARHDVNIPPSLREWVGCFTDTNDISTITHVSPTTLRILLCHLMDQVLQLRSRIDGMSTRSQNHKSSQHTSTVFLSVQVHEAQELLQKWFDLARARCPGDTAANCANMTLYHIVTLNTMVSVPKLERLARRGREATPSAGPSRPSRAGRAYHLDQEDAREIYFHCGQVLRNIRLIPEPARPPWWAGAVYRVALIAWANSMSHAEMASPQNGWDMEAPDPLLLDALTARDASIVAYLNHQGGSPVFSDANGAIVSLADPVRILLHCARFLNSTVKTKFTCGIQQKLTAMAQRWEVR